jgi:5-methylcytosine-specific restriction protein A
MTAIILGWNPDLRDRGRSYAAAVEEVASGGLSVQPWTVPAAALPGTDVWLVLEGTNVRGLAGHGVLLGHGMVEGLDQDEQFVAFDALLPLGDQVPAEVLTEAMPDVAWPDAGTGSVELGPGDELSIRDLWTRYGSGQGPDPTLPAPGTYPGNAVIHLAVNRYERDPEARRACIAQRGTKCAVCGFSFEVAYGEIGADFIHVHHTVPESLLGSNYELDPFTDLIPLCANCHAMAHYAVNTTRTEVELRRAIANAGYLRGRTVSPEELEAQRIAREILGSGRPE